MTLGEVTFNDGESWQIGEWVKCTLAVQSPGVCGRLGHTQNYRVD